jgi:hypothetical protein
MQQFVAGLLELPCRRTHCCGVRDIEFDTDLWYRPLRRPLRRPKARLDGLDQRPDTERLTTSDPFAVQHLRDVPVSLSGAGSLVAVVRRSSAMYADYPLSTVRSRPMTGPALTTLAGIDHDLLVGDASSRR